MLDDKGSVISGNPPNDIICWLHVYVHVIFPHYISQLYRPTMTYVYIYIYYIYICTYFTYVLQLHLPISYRRINWSILIKLHIWLHIIDIIRTFLFWYTHFISRDIPIKIPINPLKSTLKWPSFGHRCGLYRGWEEEEEAERRRRDDFERRRFSSFVDGTRAVSPVFFPRGNPSILYWLVVWNIFYFSIYWEYSSQLTNSYFSEG